MHTHKLYYIMFFFYYRANKIVATIISALVITINIYFVIDTVQDIPQNWAIWLGIAIFAILYLAFCIYLIIHMAVNMGAGTVSNHWVCISIYHIYALLIIIYLFNIFMF